MKQAKILADRALRREIKHILEIDRPYELAVGLVEPKPESVRCWALLVLLLR